ncbi:DNA-formamidopyrimidine glycosylase family protein [Dyadobacter psychrotolerans]|uniref:Fpg/Nei family DNA glycosylase n=1 Tax=Dyadobacter psychrotolerans TaxID=2541721 RepID=A0A4V2Z2X4_9BACT|nr:DNA-formamidopyrimidine glycosylase family protein [Dyadobacter psychrotolerans]TDE10528.1 Fpg/Nei family DNA glycosylase [Dyadobacter psychrotolerans]
MPELPDLQAFSKNLTKELKGKKLEKLEVLVKQKTQVSEKELSENLDGKTLKKVYRLGKELFFDFGADALVSMHLMLHGKLVMQMKEDELPKYALVNFIFKDGTQLILTDFQKIAKIDLNPELSDTMDALSEKLTAEWLSEKLKKSKAAIKSVLTDQKVIGGIGNAYVDEILWDAKIHPKSIAAKIPQKQIKMLAKSINEVLKDAEKKILKSNPDIISGEIRDFMVVHNSKKKTSPTGGEILIDKVGSRKTYYTNEQVLFN